MSTRQSGDGGIDGNTVNGRVAGHNVMVGGISAVNGGYNFVLHGDNHFYPPSASNEVRKSVKPFAQLYFPRNEDFIERPDITEWLEKNAQEPRKPRCALGTRWNRVSFQVSDKLNTSVRHYVLISMGYYLQKVTICHSIRSRPRTEIA